MADFQRRPGGPESRRPRRGTDSDGNSRPAAGDEGRDDRIVQDRERIQRGSSCGFTYGSGRRNHGQSAHPAVSVQPSRERSGSLGHEGSQSLRKNRVSRGVRGGARRSAGEGESRSRGEGEGGNGCQGSSPGRSGGAVRSGNQGSSSR